jgi:HK97 family phage prohead protease
MMELRRDLSVEDVDGRTFVGRALSYEQPYRVSDDGHNWYDEGWRVGAVAESLKGARNTFELRALHRDVRVGLVSFQDGSTDLRFRAIVDDSEEGAQLLDDVEQVGLPGVSLGFRPRKQFTGQGGVVWRMRALIRELSVTDRPQYPDAAVLALRSEPEHDAGVDEAARQRWEARQRALEGSLLRAERWGGIIRH